MCFTAERMRYMGIGELEDIVMLALYIYIYFFTENKFHIV